MGKVLTKKILVPLLVVVAIAAVGVSVYFYQQNQKSQQLIQNPTLAAQEQEQVLLAKVGKLIELPSDEVPQIATVADVSKLQGQPFFANAKNGNKVLIYTKNKKAILYDPMQNIIIEVAPVTLGANTIPTLTPTVTPAKSLVRKPTPTPTK